MIKIYTTPTCTWCEQTKNYLKSKDLEFEELNVAEDMLAREEMFKKAKVKTIPVLDINGKIIVGFDKEAINLALTS